MVLTYHEAVRAGAQALADRYGEDEVFIDRQNAAAVLTAVGYADLLAEVETLHEALEVSLTSRDAARAALDRARVLADGLPDAPRVRLIRANLRAGLHPIVTDTPTEICEWCHSPQHETRDCVVAKRLCDADRQYWDEEGAKWNA